jgi:hypothetical protein
MNAVFKPLDILHEPEVRAALFEAWKESKSGLIGGYEQGGFIVLDDKDKLKIRRWPVGEGNWIRVPSHTGRMIDGRHIVATFHTHPNIGPDYMQEPGETDKRGVKEDVDLKGSHYIGEFVIANEMVYLITQRREVEKRAALFG